MMNILLSFLILCFIYSCKSDKQQVLELSDYQAKTNAKAQIDEQEQYLKDKAMLMENDLQKRSNFIKQVSGSYQGIFAAQEGNTQQVEMTFSPANLPSVTSRIRTLEEISYDLNLVSLSIMIKVINSTNQQVVSSCRFTGIRPDLTGGELFLSNQDCPNFYQLELSDEQSTKNAGELAADMIELSTNENREISWKGTMIPAGKPGKNTFLVKKN